MRNNPSKVIEINVYGNVNTITNEGTISGAGIGIKVRGTVGTIEHNGTITSQNAGIMIDNERETKKVGKIIIGDGALSSSSKGYAGIHIGINAEVGTIENKGTLKGEEGIWIDSSKVDSIVNKGTLQGEKFGLVVTGKYNPAKSSKVASITNTGIISGGKAGIEVRFTNALETIKTLELMLQ